MGVLLGIGFEDACVWNSSDKPQPFQPALAAVFKWVVIVMADRCAPLQMDDVLGT